MSNGRARTLAISALLLGAGVASVVIALTTYFTRYSRFDALIGEIDPTVYSQITQMAMAEKSALIAGAVLVAVSFVAFVRALRGPAVRK